MEDAIFESQDGQIWLRMAGNESSSSLTRYFISRIIAESASTSWSGAIRLGKSVE